jgi:hypothetical protein
MLNDTKDVISKISSVKIFHRTIIFVQHVNYKNKEERQRENKEGK